MRRSKSLECRGSVTLKPTDVTSYIVPGLGDFGDRFYTM
jgi:hypothetical protein